MGILLGDCLTVKNWWGLLTGDEGIGNAFNKTPQSTFQILPAAQPSDSTTKI